MSGIVGRERDSSRPSSMTLDPAEWAKMELEEAELGDVRRTRTLVDLGARLARTPAGTLASAIPIRSELKSVYGLFRREEVTREAIIAPHIERSRKALCESGEFFVIEDTTSLNFETHVGIEDMGWMGHGNRGLTVHTAFATRVERWDPSGVPEVTAVGMVRQQVWTRKGKPKTRGESKEDRMKRPRESGRWGLSIAEIGRPPAGVRWTYMADRESDIYEVFQVSQGSGWDFIIRAKEPRAMQAGGQSIFETVRSATVLGTMTVQLRAQSARPGRAAVRARVATVKVRATTVTVRPPKRPGGGLQPVTLNVVEVHEPSPPKGIEPLHWILLTSWPCETFDQAWRVAQAYTTRWIIEEYHKALKTGAGVEKIQLSTLQRVTALFGVLSVVAVRLLNIKLMAATHPDDAVSQELVGPELLQILEVKFKKPKGQWTHRELAVAIARVGGFLGRKSDGIPGWQTFWRGWQRLMDMIEGAEIMRRRNSG